MEVYERNRSRTFTGVSDTEWDRFNTVVRAEQGGGKKSMIIATFIRMYNQLAELQFEKQATMEQKVHHAINDTRKHYGFSIIKREVDDV